MRRAAALLCLLAACRQQDTVAIVPEVVGSGYCAGSGPAIITGDGFTVDDADGTTDDVCAGAIARRTFRFALCTCEDYVTSTQLTTDSFASSEGPYAAATAGEAGSIGVNADLQTNAPLDVHGSLWAGAAGGQIGQNVTVSGDLMHAAGLTGTGATVDVGHDAIIAGPASLASLTVADQLTVPSLAGVTVSGTLSYGSLIEAATTVADPCACNPGNLIDVTRFVNLHATDNDDADVGLASSALAGYGAAPVTLELPCGRFYLDGIDGDGPLTLHVTGRTALFVGGDMNLRGKLTVIIDAGAELDLFVGGLLQSTADIDFGMPERPSKARLYVGGAGVINMTGTSVFAGNLYAPHAQLSLSGTIELYGSLFVRRLEQAGPVTLHFDTDVLEADVGCPDVPTGCDTCLDCPSQACIAGQCAACVTSADCCAPQICENGICLAAHTM